MPVHTRHPLALGVLCALGAGLLWGLVFVAPLRFADVAPASLALGRYLAFGLVALLLASTDRRRLQALGRADWRRAVALTLVGNFIYYGCLAAALQQAGGPLPTLIIGTLPVVIAICANLSSPDLPWRRLVPPLLAIGCGLLLVHAQEAGDTASPQFSLGVLLAVAAVACWTWYPLANAAWLRRHPHLSPTTWATAQGLVTLPLAVIGFAGLLLVQPTPRIWGSDPAAYIAGMAVLGLGASWAGTLLWNRASQLLPPSLTGQLIVFETLAALGYLYAFAGRGPTVFEKAGIVLLLCGVLLGVRAVSGKQRH